jgi:hypothetical protein
LISALIAHELGHLLIDRSTGNNSIAYISVTPQDGYDGICRGTLREAFATGGETSGRYVDASAVREIIAPQMPVEGEDRSGKSDVYQAVLDACVQLMGGEAAEELLIGDAAYAADDRRQANELAQLICRTPAAVAAFIAFSKQQAADLLSEHMLALISLSIVLKIRRTIEGASEIDQAIAHALAGEAAALEGIRRREWSASIERAKNFRSETMPRN